MPRPWNLLTFDPTQKPEIGAEINREIATELGLSDLLVLNENGGLIVHNDCHAAPVIAVSAPTWAVTPSGLAMRCSGGQSLDIPDHVNYAAGDVTVRVLHRPVSWTSDFTALFDRVGGGRGLSVFVNSSGNLSYTGIGGYEEYFGAGIATGMTPDNTWNFVFMRRGTTISVYCNDRFILSYANTGTASTPNSPLAFGRNPTDGGSNYDGYYVMAQVALRAWTPAQIEQGYYEPYWMFAPALARTYSIPPPGFPRHGDLLLVM